MTVPRYIYGYCCATRLWIVGMETGSGTIAKPIACFLEAAEAKLRAAELNGDQSINHKPGLLIGMPLESNRSDSTDSEISPSKEAKGLETASNSSPVAITEKGGTDDA